jgi:hypothetical protein
VTRTVTPRRRGSKRAVALVRAGVARVIGGAVILVVALVAPIASLAEPPAAEAPAADTSAAEPLQPVRAPHHGDVLFEHYQRRGVAALGSLMVSQHFDRLAPHDAEAELLRGGLLLDWGQHDEAAGVFERLAAQHPAHRDRAWTLLARARWQRGRIDEAEAALARVQAPLPGELDDDRVLLQAQIHLARGRPAEAAAVLQRLSQAAAVNGRLRGATPLARHNQAIALLQAGQFDAARAALDQIGRERVPSEEQRVLRDRANLTLALALLRQAPADERPADPAGQARRAGHASQANAAHQALQRVRLHSADSGKALLADGWAVWQQGRPRDALVPWLELAERPLAEAAVFEARLAVPQAYAELGARGEALRRTDTLLQQFEAGAQALADTRQALLDGRALSPLLQALQDHQPGQEAQLELPRSKFAATLAPVWADHRFQQALTRWADLQWVQGELQRWMRSLPAFDDMLQLRQAAFAQRLAPTLDGAQDHAHGLQALAQTRTALQAEVDAAEQAGDGVALADERQRAQLQRLQQVHRDLAALGADPNSDPDPDPDPDHNHAALAARARRVDGVLRWQLAHAQPERLWAARKALHTVDQALLQGQDRLRALVLAREQQPARFAALAARTQRLARTLADLQPRVVALADEQRVALQTLAVAVLDEQQQQLAAYRLQAQLLQAQLQDGALTAQSSTRPAGATDAQP